MNKNNVAWILLLFVLTACTAAGSSNAGAQPTASEPATTSPALLPTLTETPTSVPTETATPSYPPEGYGPSNFPAIINPLTGLEVADPSLLNRRPLAVKISNLPRSIRPQWGLSLADIVFEYYTEEGSTRFIALFYGNNADMVGPIRSARFFDAHVIRGYKAVFAFGSAWDKVLDRLFISDFSDRLVLEWSPNSPMFRYDPNGYNYLMVDTAALSDYMNTQHVENGRQNLDGMQFRLDAPAGGQPVNSLFVRYSSAIYSRWDYDPATARYLRYADSEDDFSNGAAEKYVQQTDRLTGQPLAYDNVVVLEVLHEYYDVQVWDIQFMGSGNAWAFRDGQVYPLQWQRNSPDAVVTLSYPDGTPFPFKPGTTWFEVVGNGSQLQQNGQTWRFIHKMP